ncbi:alpha/beta hydrolase [Paenibacillus sp. TRM 82003]|nr:alpha/beta hydrolase [Paenibacillus sp. TRM 82003]
MIESFELWPEGAPLALGAEAADRPSLTPYLIEGDRNAAVVVLPGGGYEFLADHEGEPIAEWLNGIGVSAFVLRYRVAPYRHPAPLLDAQRAIRLVRSRAAEFGVDPERIGILGFSAGGHLASTAATRFDAGDAASDDPVERVSCRPDAAVLCYPVVTLKHPHTHPGSRANILGDDPTPELLHSLCNEEQVTADTPPTFLWHTSEDGLVPAENSLLFASALARSGVRFDLHVYALGHHGLGLALDHPDAKGWSPACADWLRRIGFAPAAG